MNRLALVLIVVLAVVLLGSCQKESEMTQYYEQTEITIPQESYYFSSETEIALSEFETLDFVDQIGSRGGAILCHNDLLLVFDNGSRNLIIYDLTLRTKIQKYHIGGENRVALKKAGKSAFLISSDIIARFSHDGSMKKYDNLYNAFNITGTNKRLFLLTAHSQNRVGKVELIEADENLRILNTKLIKQVSWKIFSAWRWGYDILANNNYLYLMHKFQNKLSRYNFSGEVEGAVKTIPSRSLDVREKFNSEQISKSSKALYGSTRVMIKSSDKIEYRNGNFHVIIGNPDDHHRLVVFQPGKHYKTYHFPISDRIYPRAFSLSESGKTIYLLCSEGNNNYKVISFDLKEIS